jgi:hypothetical protein
LSEAVTASMARGYEVMQRQSVRYDYEKVFWNGTFTVGLIGLGWTAVKLGQMIVAAQDVYDKTLKTVVKVTSDIQQGLTNPVGSLAYNQYLVLYEWVEGVHADDTPTRYGASLIMDYRKYPEKWAAYKATMGAANTDDLDEFGDPYKVTVLDEEPELPAEKVLNYADSIFAKYGAAMPLAAVVGHVVLEYARIHKLRRDMV